MKNFLHKNRRILGFTLLGIGGFFLLLALISFSQNKVQERVFSDYTVLTLSWENYKKNFIQADGRVIDYSQNSVTTSEGQSYALLRAVWMGDRETFDRVWDWTKNNLRRPDDALFGWRWGERSDGRFGLLPDGGENSASDADTDIALALILAQRRWGEQRYLEEARPLLQDIWEKETAQVGKRRYLTAGNWAASEDEVILNPSYFAPYAWRIFDEVDQERDWKSLVDPAYQVLLSASEQTLDASRSAGLPPDWITLNRDSGQLEAPQREVLTTNYSYDAFRVPWRVALDYHWNQEHRAARYLESMMPFLVEEYQRTGKLLSGYSHAGEPLVQYENPTMYSTFLSGLTVTDPQLAEAVYTDKILEMYSSDENSFLVDLPYYEQNWLWFGAAMHLQSLPNFSGEESG